MYCRVAQPHLTHLFEMCGWDLEKDVDSQSQQDADSICNFGPDVVFLLEEKTHNLPPGIQLKISF